MARTSRRAHRPRSRRSRQGRVDRLDRAGPGRRDRAVSERRPPRLLVKTLTVSFITVALLLAVVFVVVTLSVRNQVRQAVASNLESTQRLFATVETRRQRELRAQAETLADNATLNAALDTYLSETRGTGG